MNNKKIEEYYKMLDEYRTCVRIQNYSTDDTSRAEAARKIEWIERVLTSQIEEAVDMGVVEDFAEAKNRLMETLYTIRAIFEGNDHGSIARKLTEITCADHVKRAEWHLKEHLDLEIGRDDCRYTLVWDKGGFAMEVFKYFPVESRPSYKVLPNFEHYYPTCTPNMIEKMYLTILDAQPWKSL